MGISDDLRPTSLHLVAVTWGCRPRISVWNVTTLRITLNRCGIDGNICRAHTQLPSGVLPAFQGS